MLLWMVNARGKVVEVTKEKKDLPCLEQRGSKKADIFLHQPQAPGTIINPQKKRDLSRRN